MLNKIIMTLLFVAGMSFIFLAGCQDNAQHAAHIEKSVNVVVVNVTNSNGSFTPVVIKHVGDAWIGPYGEQYSSMPTDAQLRPLYGLSPSPAPMPAASAPAPVPTPTPVASAPIQPQPPIPATEIPQPPQPAPTVVTPPPLPVQVVSAPPPPAVVVAPAPVYVPEYYVWDGYEYVGCCGNQYVYWVGGRWTICNTVILGRFHGWERYHPHWRGEAIHWHDHDHGHEPHQPHPHR